VVKVHAQGQEALSTFTPLTHFGKVATLMSVSIGTGRTHQIRVHAAHAGYPIAFDEKYGDREKDAALKPFGLQRMFLHAYSLEFARPGNRGPFRITAEIPEELRAVIERLEEAYPSTRTARAKQS
jgi:23S rRNA pseudouridine955/2504/2580 synthase